MEFLLVISSIISLGDTYNTPMFPYEDEAYHITNLQLESHTSFASLEKDDWWWAIAACAPPIAAFAFSCAIGKNAASRPEYLQWMRSK